MASRERADYLTTAAGGAGVAGARALSHHALEDAYNKGKRPKVAAERAFLHTSKGRGKFLAASGLLLASAPPFAVGLNNVITRKEPLAKRDNVFTETQHGVTDSLAQRSALWKDPAPIHRQAQNYGVSALIAGAGGGTGGLALRKAKMGGGKKAAITGLAAATAGVASLPAQDKLMQRTSHNAYHVTPTGVSRGRKRSVRASTKADRVTRRDGREIPSRFGKAMSAEQIKAARKLLLRQMPAPVKARSLSGPYERPAFMSPQPARRTTDPTWLKTFEAGRKSTPRDVAKLDGYRGDNMPRAKKRALVMGAASIPVIPFAGDIAAASTAASLAPPELRKKTAALQFGGAQAGGLAGGAAGAYGLAAAAKHPKVQAGIDTAGKKAADVKAGVRSKLGMAPKIPKSGPNPLERVAAKSPKAAGRAMKPLLRNPKTALAGAAIGAFAGGQAGGYAGYGHALNLEDKRNGVTKSQDNRHGSRVAKYASPPAMNQREKKQLAHRKEITAGLSVAGSATGLSALGTTVASRALKRKNPRLSGKLKAASVPLLTAGAGFGGVNGLFYAAIQHKEARRKQVASKSYVPGMVGWAPITNKGSSGIRAVSHAHRAMQKIRLLPANADPKAGVKALRRSGLDKLPAKSLYPHVTGTGVHKPLSAPRPSSQGRKIWPGQSSPKGKTTVVEHHPGTPRDAQGNIGAGGRKLSDDNWGGDAAYNGRGGGVIRINSQQSAHGQDKALEHEKRHIAPRRNPVHLQNRMMRDEATTGREEGRADIHRPRGGPDMSTYAGSPEFRRGYEEVQRKIRYSQAHGKGVGKSLVNGVGWRPITNKGLSGIKPMTKDQIKLHRYELEAPATGAKKKYRGVLRQMGFDSKRATHEDIGVHRRWQNVPDSRPPIRRTLAVAKSFIRLPKKPRITPLKAAGTRRGGLVRTGSAVRTRRGVI